jgi:hypothetical protein
LKLSPYASNWASSIENILALDCALGIDGFGSSFIGFGLHGKMLLSLSNQKPLLVGIVPVSAFSGVCGRVQRPAAGPE